jgi:hypothetical protein
MATDYIPDPDNDFTTWLANLLTYAAANAAALGLVPADLAPLTAQQTAWTAALTDHGAAQAGARSAREAKDAARHALETAVRALVKRLQASADVDDAERRALGITVADTVRTATSPEAAASRPRGAVDAAQRLRHTIAFFDEATPTRRAKPAGVMGCEIWVKIGDPAPTDPTQCQFLALDTATPYTAEYPGANAGKTAHYLLRWVTTRGDKGPWSETVSATIGA